MQAPGELGMPLALKTCVCHQLCTTMLGCAAPTCCAALARLGACTLFPSAMHA